MRKSLWVFMILKVFFLFLIFNAPSLKIFLGSELINIIGVIGLWITGVIIYRNKLTITKHQIYFLVTFSILWILLILSGIFGIEGYVDNKIFIQYLGLYFSVVGILLFNSYNDISKFVFLQVSWAILITTFNFMGIINLNKDLGNHYLTVGVPIATGLICVFGLIIMGTNKKQQFLMLFISIYLIFGLTSLNGRSPILFSLAIIICFYIWISIRQKSFKKKIRKLISFLLLFTIGYNVLLNTLSDTWINRFLRIFSSSDEESREGIYNKAYNLFIEMPFGYGINAHDRILGHYPHNIILELLLSGGIIALLLFIILILLFIKIMIKTSVPGSYLIVMSMITVYFLMTWNVSFNLTSSYLPFGSIALVVSSYKNKLLTIEMR